MRGIVNYTPLYMIITLMVSVSEPHVIDKVITEVETLEGSLRNDSPISNPSILIESDLIADLRITYSQDRKKILTKYMRDVEMDGNDINVTLTQEDTFKFKEKKPVFVQLKIKVVDGQVFNSDLIVMRVEPALDNEVI